jgi:hypothetical protein
MFNSCIVTIGMVISRFVELLFCAIIIDTFGFMIVSEEGLPLTPIYIVGIGILFVIGMCICGAIIFIFMGFTAYIFTILIDIYKTYKKYIPTIPLRIKFNFNIDKFLNYTVATCRKR